MVGSDYVCCRVSLLFPSTESTILKAILALSAPSVINVRAWASVISHFHTQALVIRVFSMYPWSGGNDDGKLHLGSSVHIRPCKCQILVQLVSYHSTEILNLALTDSQQRRFIYANRFHSNRHSSYCQQSFRKSTISWMDIIRWR